jgi:CheY-like chemotaxis protein
MQRILLVDDDEALRKMLGMKLVMMGYAIAEAANGKEALAAQQREPADLILTDLIMPEKEGIETIGEFRKKYPKAKIIAMSGGSRVSAAENLKMARLIGADLALAKPFSNQALAEAIAAVLPKA